MKVIFIKISYILLITAFIIGCNSEKVNNPLYSELNGIKNDVDIWSSINYQIITDKKKIEEVEPATDDEMILLNILIKLENKGQEKAESFNAQFNESVPFKYKHGSGNQGIDHGYLDKGEKYEIYRYYTFNTKGDVEDFITNSNILVEWKEKGENKRIILKLPSNPTR